MADRGGQWGWHGLDPLQQAGPGRTNPTKSVKILQYGVTVGVII